MKMKYRNGPRLMQFTGLTMFLTFLEHLAWWSAECPFKNYQDWGEVLQEAVHVLNLHPTYGTVFLIVRIHRSRNQKMEMEVVPLFITPSFSWEKNCFLCLWLFALLVKKSLFQYGVLPPVDTTMILLNWKLRLSPGHSELLMPLNQQAKLLYWLD